MATIPTQPHEAMTDLNKAKSELEKAIEKLKNKPGELSPDDIEKMKKTARAFFDINGIC